MAAVAESAVVAGHPVGGGGASPRRNHPQGALVMHGTPGDLEALIYIAIAVGDGRAAEECGRPDDRHPDRRRGRAVHGSLSRGPEGLQTAMGAWREGPQEALALPPPTDLDALAGLKAAAPMVKPSGLDSMRGVEAERIAV